VRFNGRSQQEAAQFNGRNQQEAVQFNADSRAQTGARSSAVPAKKQLPPYRGGAAAGAAEAVQSNGHSQQEAVLFSAASQAITAVRSSAAAIAGIRSRIAAVAGVAEATTGAAVHHEKDRFTGMSFRGYEEMCRFYGINNVIPDKSAFRFSKMHRSSCLPYNQ